MNKIILLTLTLFLTLTAHAGPDLDRIKSKNKMVVSTDPAWPPYSFLNESNKMDGFDIDVAKEIAKRMNVKIEFVTPEWDVITSGNWNDRWDISVGSMTPTVGRAQILDFPAIYYYTPASFAVHKDSKVTSIKELNGKTIGVCVSCTFEQYLKQDLTIDAVGVPEFTYDVKPGKILSLKDSAAVFDDMRIGDGKRMDGMIDSLPAILEAIDNGYPIKTVGKPAFYEPLAVAIDKGDPELAAEIKRIVDAMKADGTLSNLSKKWLGVDYTQSN